ncbi:PorP/SprF family type IX secretion system membrane protein [Mucilaginibacter sp. X4EP1]|uniref:PorP/SprF family type IX secretion system membrane protein n=1 Tax=Mucilaginibacter sp. X4EP1 TaxID=2723092 RepID=UPI00216A04F2|nr:PorP/SprF family type IX secretion system membrane protein [Mucilaginibacter sp. X4EP1]MCS3813875.1 type IX secretion system PorP/SprF family membrane protein [Mucilaginibacter sp. X4EP1]
MRKTILIISVLLTTVVLKKADAQVDPHFSQYYAYPIWLNPALTGAFDGETRLTADFKNQWAGISNGYNTGGLSMDFHPTAKVGIGLNMLDQSAGTAGYNYFTGGISFGYGIAVSGDGYKKISFGVQAAFINRSFDPSKLELDNQYNPAIGFDPTLPGFENFSITNSFVFDSSAGVFYYDTDPESKAKVFGGVSVAHLTDEKDPFAVEGLKSTLPMRFTIHGGVKIAASDVFDITPHIIYIRQQQNQIKGIGAYSELKLQDNNGLILGGMYQINDSATADVGYRLKNMVIGISYDINTSPLNAAVNGQGGFELSINYIFGKKSNSNTDVIPMF